MTVCLRLRIAVDNFYRLKAGEVDGQLLAEVVAAMEREALAVRVRHKGSPQAGQASGEVVALTEERRKVILTMLRLEGESLTRQVTEALGMSQRSVLLCLGELENDGLVMRRPRRDGQPGFVWELTGDG